MRDLHIAPSLARPATLIAASGLPAAEPALARHGEGRAMAGSDTPPQLFFSRLASSFRFVAAPVLACSRRRASPHQQ